jgi:hypothetical protein
MARPFSRVGAGRCKVSQFGGQAERYGACQEQPLTWQRALSGPKPQGSRTLPAPPSFPRSAASPFSFSFPAPETNWTKLALKTLGNHERWQALTVAFEDTAARYDGLGREIGQMASMGCIAAGINRSALAGRTRAPGRRRPALTAVRRRRVRANDGEGDAVKVHPEIRPAICLSSLSTPIGHRPDQNV